MAKKILDSLIDQSGPGTGSSSKANSVMDYVLNQSSPLTREGSNNEQVQQGFEGDSQYDSGLGYLVDQNQLRARNQPWIDQVGNSLVKAVPGTALKILENAGDLGELVFDWDKDKEYTNMFTELAKAGQEALNDKFHTYQETPADKFASPADSGWWFNMGDGLVQSVGAFWATGAGVGGTLSKGAKALNAAIKGGELGAKITQGAAQLGTASSLAYTEGIQSAAQVYEATKKQKISEGLPELEAKKLASEAASKTMMLNTVINTGLNITSLSPLFKSFGHLDDGIRQQLSRKAKETLPKYIERLGQLESQGVKQASIMKTLGLEAMQEGIEEDVNLYSENEGYRQGGVEDKVKSNKPTAIGRFIDTAFSEEGAINFLSGAVGGVAQTAGFEYAPLRTYTDDAGKKSRMSARNLEAIQQQKHQRETIHTFKTDLEYLQQKQEALNAAVASKDQNKIEEARQDLFNIAALKSIRQETIDELTQEIGNIGSVDNTKLGPDQLTDAERQGLADNVDDHRYREKAASKSADLKMLNKEYRNLQAEGTFTSNFALNEAFRQRMDVYSTEKVLEDVQKNLVKTQADLANLFPDPDSQQAIMLKAELNGLEIALKELEKRKSPVSKDISTQYQVAKQAYADLTRLNHLTETRVKGNSGIVNKLTPHYANRAFVQSKLDDRQSTYRETLNDPKKFEQKLNKEVEKVVKVQEAVKKEKEAQVNKIKEQEDLETAKSKKVEEDVKNLIKPVKETTPVVESVSAPVDIKIESTEPGAKTISVEQIQTINPIDQAYHGKTQKEQVEEESALLDIISSINEENNSTYGYHNKIAYKAQAQGKDYITLDPSVINDRYKILHSSSFGEGTSVTLRPVTLDEHKQPELIPAGFFENPTDKEIATTAIAIFHDNRIVGYLPVYKNQQKDLLLARAYVLQHNVVSTKISKKTVGNLNKGTTHPVQEAFPILPKFAIGVSGSFNTNTDAPYIGNLINSKQAKTGYVYAITSTPNGQEIAIPVDINNVSEEIASSIITALDIYINADQLEDADKQVVRDTFDKYGIDITTQKGLQDYVNLFVHTTDLTDPENIVKFNTEQKDNYYIQVSQNGLRFMQSGRAIKDKKGNLVAREVGKNTPEPNKFYNDLKKHLQNTYFRVDLTKLTSKKEFQAPIFQVGENSIEVKDYTQPSYANHVAANTTTNIVGVKLSDTEQTIMVQPSLFLDYSFLNKDQVLLKTDSDGNEKVAILASNQPNVSGVARNPNRRKAPQNVTQQDANNLKDNCN